MREASIGADGNFSHEGFINRVNTDLTNDWANLVSRTTGMIEKYFANSFRDGASYTEKENGIRDRYLELEKTVLDNFDQYQFNRGLESIFDYINSLNRYIVEAQPWNLAKEKENEPRLAAVLKTLARAILSVNTLLSPILPETAAKVRGIFNSPDLQLGWKNLPETFAINPGMQLFPRVDGKVFFAEGDAAPQEARSAGGCDAAPGAARHGDSEGLIEIQDFKKVQMVVARVLEAQKVEKADKLLQLKIDTGERYPHPGGRDRPVLQARGPGRPQDHHRQEPEAGQAARHPFPGHDPGRLRCRQPPLYPYSSR